MSRTPTPVRLLFLCTGNSCRSQMAEAWARHLWGDRVVARSAGVEPAGLNPLAVRAMAEAGVDMAGQRAKHVDELADLEHDLVITVCDRAGRRCPVFRSPTQVMHMGFDDPPELARDAPTEEEALAPYRRVRDEIHAFIERLPETLRDMGLEMEGAERG